MKTIFKYVLQFDKEQIVKAPRGAKFISADIQHNYITIWAIVDTEQAPIDIPIYIIGTGHEMPEKVIGHIGSVIMEDGNLVFHVFEGVSQ